MDRQKAGGKTFHRLFAFKIRTAWLIFTLLFLLTAAGSGFLTRPLWFDEVLVMLNFASLASPAEIYQSYYIPNNQIVHTVCLYFLREQPEICWRFFSLLCGGAVLSLLWQGWRKRCGDLPLAAVLWTWMFSVPFMLYATAVRGYMLASLLTVLAWLCGRKYAVSKKITAAAGWFFCTYLAVGVMPSALSGIAAAGLYILPLLGRKFYRKKEFYILALLPAAAFMAFYLPIWERLTGAFAIREGWHNAPAAYLALILGVTGSFNVLLPAAAWGLRKKHWDFRQLCYLLIWLLPLGMFIFPVAPFPRVWLVVFPVWAVLLAQGLKRSRLLKKVWLLPVIMAGAMHFAVIAQTVSPWCSLAGQDDFFAPFFLRSDFTPELAAQALKKVDFNGRIYMPLSADPWAVMWQIMRQVEFDSPRGRVRDLTDDTAVILGRQSSPHEVISRFGGRLIYCCTAGGYRIYLWRQR